MSDAQDLKVTFTAKELLGRIDERLASIDSKLDAKADLRDVLELQKRIDRVEKFADETRARSDKSSVLFSRWQQIGVLILMTLGVLAQPLLTHLGG